MVGGELHQNKTLLKFFSSTQKLLLDLLIVEKKRRGGWAGKELA